MDEHHAFASALAFHGYVHACDVHVVGSIWLDQKLRGLGNGFL